MSQNPPHQLLKSVSAPVSATLSRGKGFVRPNCSTTFWLQCPVCCKRYFKYDSHFECFSRWCEICQDVLPTAAALTAHCQEYHKANFCEKCNYVYENIKGHRTFEHANDGNNEGSSTASAPKLKLKQKRTRMTRATTTATATTNFNSN
jgi:hypothetical protein